MGIVQYIIFGMWVLGLIMMTVFILMHSGKGSGFSDAAATSLYSSKGASAVMERNLDRLTNIAIAMFVASIFASIIWFPVGTLL